MRWWQTAGVVLSAVAISAFAACLIRARTWAQSLRKSLDKRSKLITTAKGDVEYVVYGSSGPVILVSHDTPGGHDQMAVLHRPFVEHGYRVLVISRPGYLRSGIELGMSVEEQADLLGMVLDALELDSVIIFAISGGCPAALEFAVRHRHRCLGVILYACVSYASSFSNSALSLPRNIYAQYIHSRLVEQWPQHIATEMREPQLAAAVASDPVAREIFQSLHSCWLHDFQRRHAGMCNDIAQFASLVPAALDTIKAPMLIIHGKADKHNSVQNAMFVKEHVPHAQLVLVEDATHFALCTHHERVIQEMLQFVQSVISPS